MNTWLNLLVEALFGAVFLGALVTWLRRRDPLIREVTFAFAGLASLFVIGILGEAGAVVPPLVSRAAAVLLLAQPVFTLRLLAHIRPVPAWLLPAAYLVGAPLFAAVLVLPEGSPNLVPASLAAFALFLALEILAAGYFFLEARRRWGAARVRLNVAGLATGLMAAAILVLLLGVARSEVRSAVNLVAQLLALVAAVGYLVAFLPPPFLRRSWQAGTAYRLGNRLLASADAADPGHAWQRFAELAAELTGAEAAVVRGPDATVRAAIGVRPTRVEPDAVERLLAEPSPPLDRPIAQVEEPWRSIAKTVDARFLTVARVDRRGTREQAVLLVYSRRRSLFGEDDLDLLTSLGTQAGILAERATLASDLSRSLDELRSASAAKSDFLASMSHELRTPLNAIIGFSELMRMERPEGDRVAIPTEWVDHVAAAGQHLLDLINDVLDLAKVEAGRLELDVAPLDLDVAVMEWMGGVRPLADRKDVRLSTRGEGGTIEADRGRLRQIVYNLLSNAIKFTPPGGEVRVELRRDGPQVSISVVDTGIGIAPEDHDAVFEEFRQVGRAADRQPGTGLGLALTRRLVQAHHGTIELDSHPGQGSRFTVRLPQATEPARLPAGPADAATPASEPADGEILVIEDDPGAVRLLRESLEGAGWHVRVAADGYVGLASAREQRPDAIVLDVMLPGLDGWDVLRALKADPDLRDVPVLMQTVVDEREVGLALGAADYLVKPVERSALLARLARYTFTSKVREREVRVLVVDDDPTAVAMVADTLEQEGFSVARANGGREALELARAAPPDVVVSDLVMPEVDGFALVAALKADPRTRDAPILVVTGHDISDADKDRLNGHILGVVAKGGDVREGLQQWLSRIRRTSSAASPPVGGHPAGNGSQPGSGDRAGTGSAAG